MRQIYKYELNIIDHQYLRVANGEQILSVKEQDGSLVAYIIINHNMPDQITEYSINIYGTGHEINNRRFTTSKHVDTVMMPNGLVWHVFCSHYRGDTKIE